MRLCRSLPLILIITAFSCRERPKPDSASTPVPAAEPVVSIGPALPLKIAWIDMDRLFNGYRRIDEIRKELHTEQMLAKAEAGLRLETLRSLEAELESSSRRLADPTVAESMKVEVAQDRASQFENAVAMERERREFMDQTKTRINEAMIARRMGIIEEIKALIREIAKREDYDYVFNSSGLTHSQIPFFLHSVQSQDLTEMVLKELNRNQGSQTNAGVDDEVRIEETD